MIPKGLCKNKITNGFSPGNQKKISKMPSLTLTSLKTSALLITTGLRHLTFKNEVEGFWPVLRRGITSANKNISTLSWTFWETPTELSNRWALRLHLLALEKMPKKLRPVVSETLQKWKNWKSYMQKIYNTRGTFRFHDKKLTEMVTRNGTTPANMFSFSNACSL